MVLCPLLAKLDTSLGGHVHGNTRVAKFNILFSENSAREYPTAGLTYKHQLDKIYGTNHAVHKAINYKKFRVNCTMVERRFSPRFPLKQTVIMHSTRSTTNAVLVNVSTGGLAIISPYPLLMGASVTVDTLFPAATNISRFFAQCCVTGAKRTADENKYLVGLQFIDVADSHRNVLAQFIVRERRRRPSIPS